MVDGVKMRAACWTKLKSWSHMQLAFLPGIDLCLVGGYAMLSALHLGTTELRSDFCWASSSM